jgi:integrase/recombinase XerD
MRELISRILYIWVSRRWSSRKLPLLTRIIVADSGDRRSHGSGRTRCAQQACRCVALANAGSRPAAFPVACIAAGGTAGPYFPGSKPTIKLKLAAVRMLYDFLVVRQIKRSNPAHSVRGPKYVVQKGKTPVWSREDAKTLLDSIPKNSVSGLRDLALIAAMFYSFARVSAVLKLKVDDYYHNGARRRLRLHEKGGKEHDMPVHHLLEQILNEYIEAAGLQSGQPLFQSVNSAGMEVTGRALNRYNAWAAIRKRAKAAGFLTPVGCHTWRATGITIYLENDGRLEHAQQMAGHESPRTTKLYDRTKDEITLSEVERIRL